LMVFINREWQLIRMSIFNDFSGHIPDLVVAKKGVWLEIIYPLVA